MVQHIILVFRVEIGSDHGFQLADPEPFVCTVEVARSVWSVFPTKLPDVCRLLSIPLRHHDASSDAKACARIVLVAQRAGWGS